MFFSHQREEQFNMKEGLEIMGVALWTLVIQGQTDEQFNCGKDGEGKKGVIKARFLLYFGNSKLDVGWFEFLGLMAYKPSWVI